MVGQDSGLSLIGCFQLDFDFATRVSLGNQLILRDLKLKVRERAAQQTPDARLGDFVARGSLAVPHFAHHFPHLAFGHSQDQVPGTKHRDFALHTHQAILQFDDLRENFCNILP